ncbi:unnamed protein product [Polarella glacialis]|uniref:YqaJ viral recombinase domain-containing protein n=1 Tax=Polarella glacialis TaxID=89957 RepID=A0A813JIG2_POLGL|nr:unnamed protein product [Polarella glacialis]CAE8675947.1 unnamed protein product [Polarella glacialis]
MAQPEVVSREFSDCDPAEQGEELADIPQSSAEVADIAQSCSEDILASLQVTDEDVQLLLAAPQRYADGRAHKVWLEGRRNRLTASRFASACGAQGARGGRRAAVGWMLSLPEASPSQASRFGIQNEGEAREAYLSWRREGAPNVEVREVGLCVWREEPWLAGSPDGVCFEVGKPTGLLEVKTARYWNEAFERDELPVDWTYQVHGCMKLASAALGESITWCDLFLWTPEQQACRRIDFDENLWLKVMFPALRCFYFEHFLPEAAERERRRKLPKRQKNGRRKTNRKGR